MKKKLISFLLLPLCLFAYNPNPPPPPVVIEAELAKAENDFYKAREMFNPWYAGPLLTPSAHTLDPGFVVIQPYVFIFDNYAKFDRERESVKIPHDLIQVNPVFIIQTGIIKGWDIAFTFQGVYNSQNHVHSGGYNDTKVSMGIQIVPEKPYTPAVKLGLAESFPSGKYRNLDPAKNGLDATGSGSFVTSVSLNISKVVWWIMTHPMNIRSSLVFSFPSKAHVRGFNAYGGGFGTDGRVRPAKQFTGDLGLEYSFTQRWVFAMDLNYVYFGDTRFSGKNGVTASGAPASNINSFGDQLSLAPAIEYNPSSKIGILGGVWFSVYGRNTSNFVTGVVSYTQTF